MLQNTSVLCTDKFKLSFIVTTIVTIYTCCKTLVHFIQIGLSYLL
jgi:hypothetical protein